MTAGTDIAAEVAAALIEAGEATGDGALVCTIKRPASGGSEPTTPWDAEDTAAGAPAHYEVTAIQNNQRVRDASGTLIGTTMRTLTVDATGVTPLKSDLIAVGVAMADADANTVYEGISEVVTEAVGGVALFHEVTLED